MDGLAVTSIPRTLVDLARTLPFERGLVPADAALHTHLVTRASLDEALNERRAAPATTPPGRCSPSPVPAR